MLRGMDSNEYETTCIATVAITASAPTQAIAVTWTPPAWHFPLTWTALDSRGQVLRAAFPEGVVTVKRQQGSTWRASLTTGTHTYSIESGNPIHARVDGQRLVDEFRHVLSLR